MGEEAERIKEEEEQRGGHKFSSMLIFLPMTLRGLFSSKENTINCNQPWTHFQKLYVFRFMIIKLNVHGFSFKDKKNVLF